MTQLQPEQCRAARALLDWDQRELSRRSKVTQATIANFERGKTMPWARTLEDLRKTFEAEGIEFLGAEEGVREIGVQIRPGFKAITRTTTQADSHSEDKGGLDALGWDWDADPIEDNEPLPPLDWTDEDRAEQIEHWRARPEAWARLHEVSRQCLLRAMRMDSLGAEWPDSPSNCR
jgi:transcriptional regulator with XRE-family HTH domain